MLASNQSQQTLRNGTDFRNDGNVKKQELFHITMRKVCEKDLQTRGVSKCD